MGCCGIGDFRMSWIKGKDFPEFYTEESLKTISQGYVQENESPVEMYRRVAKSVASYLHKPELEQKFFDLMWQGKLCPATPVLANTGTDRGLNISCNSIHVGDSVDSIYTKKHEFAMLQKHGAGVGIYMGDVRGRGAKIKGNGKSEGVIPWCKEFDVTSAVVSQGNTRRGAGAVYLPITHIDIRDFVNMRRANQDEYKRCMNIHHAVCIDDAFMERVRAGDKEAQDLIVEVYKARVETGEPYLFFTDNVNKANPESYVKNNLTVKTSNICSEIVLYTDVDHSFVCCLSSLNLTNWNNITDDDIFYSVVFLDGVLSEYIEKAQGIRGLEAAVRSAEKGRALGLGVLGWHSLLQSEGTAFNSFRAKLLNKAIFDKIRKNADRASEWLATEYGEPEWCKGLGRRNTHTMAVAPTASNSIIAGSVSQGIEPLAANAFAKKTAKGTFISHNPYLKKVLESLGKDTPDVWTSIATTDGSVQHLDFLSDDLKKVFLTAYEIDQLAIIDQAADRQVYIDQAQSLNLFFYADVDPRYFHAVHFTAWERGIKSLYYCRTSTVIKGDVASRNEAECLACHG
jgi:ribonucleoside-diphosphate reductase alpha chain